MKKKLLLYTLPFIILVYIFHNYFFSKQVITFGDFGYISGQLLKSWFVTLSYIWATFHVSESFLPIINFFGFNYLAGLIAFFGFDYAVASRILFFIPYLVLAYIGNILLLRKIIGKDSVFIILAPFIFIFNPFMLLLAAWPNMPVAAALISFALYCSIRLFEELKIKWALFLGIIFFVCVVYEIRVAFIMSLISVFYTLFYLLFLKPKNQNMVRVISKYILAPIVVILLGLFIILPLLLSKDISSITKITSESLFGVEFYTLRNAFTLFDPYWTGTNFTIFHTQPIQLYYWIFPIIAFGALFFYKRNQYILFFAILGLFGVFMAKGASDPFGQIYAWLFYHLPFFNFFREPIQWSIIAGFSYAVLSVFSLYYMKKFCVDSISGKSVRKKTFANLLYILPTICLVALLCVLAYPVFSGSIKLYTHVQTIPDEYKKVATFIQKDNFFYRTLSMPETPPFIYSDNVHPSFGVPYLMDLLQGTLDKKILNRFGIRYVFLPTSYNTYDVYKNFAPKETFERFLSSQNQLVYKADIGGIKVWENTSYLPHIYLSSDIIYITGQIGISQLSDLPMARGSSYISTIKPLGDVDAKTLKAINASTGLAVSNASQIFAVGDCIRCDLSKDYFGEIQFPFARFLPDSPIYPYILFKENKALNAITDPAMKQSQTAFYIEKRIVEIQQMVAQKVDKAYIIQSIHNLRPLLASLGEISIQQATDYTNNDNLLLTTDYLFNGKKTIDDLTPVTATNALDADLKAQLSDISDKINTLLQLVTKSEWVTKGNTKKLLVSIPEDGTYTLLLRKDVEGGLSENNSIAFIGKSFNPVGVTTTWVNYGNLTLKKGLYPVETEAVPENLMITNDAITELTGPYPQTGKYKLPIVSLQDPNGSYELSFEYRIVSGDKFRVFISTNSDLTLDDGLVNHSVDSLITENDIQWHTSKTFFSPHYGYGITDASLNFWVSSSKGDDAQVEVKNIKLIKITTPTILFIKSKQIHLGNPQITYQEINPTDYLIHVTHATNPFFLAFSEKYDSGWKAYIQPEIKEPGIKPAAIYDLSSRVNELPYANAADTWNILQTTMQKPIAESNHEYINDFENGWFVNKTGNFTIRLVYQPQQYFLIGLFLSCISAVGIIIFLIYLLSCERRKL